MRLDPKATAVDLSRAAKQWQTLGETKIAAGRNAGDRDGLRRLSSLLDAIGPFRKAQELWVETGKLLREVGSSNERSAAVADQQVAACDRQIEFCSQSFYELVLERASDKERPATQAETRIAAYEFERNADKRPIEWMIVQLKADPALGRREAWGDHLDLWWLAEAPRR